MITIAIPVVNQHLITEECIYYLCSTKLSETQIVIVDNGSKEPYHKSELPWEMELINNKENLGYYYPLLQIYNQYPDSEFVGIMHNDLYIYDNDWDVKIKKAFDENPTVGVIGVVGSREVDTMGFRGRGTMCNFRGDKGQSQSLNKRVTGFEPVLMLDGLLLVFRRECIPILDINEDTPLFNFVDRGWCLKLYKAGWAAGMIGIEVDHVGGMTELADTQYESDARKWLKKRRLGIRGQNGSTTMFQVAEKRYFDAFRGDLIPARIDENWRLIK